MSAIRTSTIAQNSIRARAATLKPLARPIATVGVGLITILGLSLMLKSIVRDGNKKPKN